jgi:hypothetical protein
MIDTRGSFRLRNGLEQPGFEASPTEREAIVSGGKDRPKKAIPGAFRSDGLQAGTFFSTTRLLLVTYVTDA